MPPPVNYISYSRKCLGDEVQYLFGNDLMLSLCSFVGNFMKLLCYVIR